MHEVFFELAASQSGVVTRLQLVQLGLSEAAVGRRVDSGLLRPVFDGAYCVASTGVDRRQKIIAGVLLHRDSAADGGDAAELLGLEPPRTYVDEPALLAEPVRVVVPQRDRFRVHGIEVRRQLRQVRADFTSCAGVPCLSPSRLVVDMAGRWPVSRTAALFDAGLRSRMLTVATVLKRHHELPRRGRKGVEVLDSLLSERTDGQHRSTNALEAFVRRLLREAGFPDPVRQHRVRFGSRSRYVDLAYPGMKVGIEVDGYVHHSQRTDWVADQIRSNELVANGWRLLRVTAEVRTHPEAFLSQVSTLLRR
jgi:very-short-patch-repair endonuclease